MIRVGAEPNIGGPGEDAEFCGLVYPDGDEISKHMAARLRSEPFYQSDKLAAALALVKSRRTAIDCGAWVGGWSRELAKHFARVIAIEANPDNARCVGVNAGRENVQVHNVALSDKPGLVSVKPEHNGPNVGSRVVHGESGQIESITLDALLSGFSDLGPVDYIKIHVNGMEFKALLGAEATIRRHRPVLTVVLKPALVEFGSSPMEARLFLRNVGYRPAGGERPYEIWVPA